MKKIFCIIMSVMILMTFIPAVFAGELTELEITNVVNGYSSFYSNGMNNNANKVDSATAGNALLRQGGEWVSYDVSSLSKGTYELTLSLEAAGNALNVARVYIDDVLSNVYTFGRVGDASWNGDNTDTVLGNVFIPENAQDIKIKSDGSGPFQFNKLYLKKVSEQDTTSKDIRIYGTNITHKTDYHDAPAYTTDTSAAKPNSIECRENIDYHIQNTTSYAFSNNYIGGTTGYTIMRANDWARYEVSGMKGTYRVKFYAGTSSNTSVELQIGNKVLLESTLTGNGNYNAVEEEVGLLYIPENTDYLRLNILTAATYLRYMDFEYVSPDDTTAVYKKTFNYNQYNNYSAISPLRYGTDSYKAQIASAHDDYASKWIYDVTPDSTNLYRESAVVYNSNNEWAKWDISVVPAGVYDITVNRKSHERSVVTYHAILLDSTGSVIDTVEMIWGPDGTGSTYTPLTAVNKGIKIPAEAHYLVMKRISSTSGAVYITGFTFDGTYTIDTKFTSDEAGENIIEEIGENETVYAQIEMENSTPTRNITVITAVYEGDELVKAVPYKNITVYKSGNLSETYQVAVEKGQKVKLLVWDNLDEISPLGGVSVIE